MTTPTPTPFIRRCPVCSAPTPKVEDVLAHSIQHKYDQPKGGDI